MRILHNHFFIAGGLCPDYLTPSVINQILFGKVTVLKYRSDPDKKDGRKDVIKSKQTHAEILLLDHVNEKALKQLLEKGPEELKMEIGETQERLKIKTAEILNSIEMENKNLKELIEKEKQKLALTETKEKKKKEYQNRKDLMLN